MTPTHTTTGPKGTAPAAPRTGRTGPPRRLLLAATVAACLPYLGIKTAWLSGVHIGIPEGSELLAPENTASLTLANSLTLVMDAAVVVLALALALPWGRRLPAWLTALPLWTATGLLAPIAVAVPVLSLLGAATGDGTVTQETRASLDGWVFTVVYTGFGIQALTLGALAALYVRDRWGHLLRGRLAALDAAAPTAPARRAIAVTAAAAALLPLVTQLLWSAGARTGLPAHQAERTDNAFRLIAGLDALAAAAAAAGILLLAFPAGRAGAIRLRTAVALAWTGSGVLTARGGWSLLTGLFDDGMVDPSRQATALMTLTYSVEVLAGMLVLATGAHLFAERAAERAAEPATGRAPDTAHAAHTGHTGYTPAK
ncbi:hypothetical protein ACLIYP_06780 [Streptomyces nanhaiensis]|uniref:hypothetical protein n=1 Tax=Streptomyces nanhaiensis TaxID=679319 RepID=UPI00399D518C